jgi:hypothetical protein
MSTPEFDRLCGCIPLFEGFLKGDAEAVQFAVRIFRAAHIWDDLVDKDKPVTDEELYAVFWDLLINLPADRFYQKHFSLLSSTLMNAMMNWRVANTLEREGSEKDKSIAFVLRGAYVDILTVSALIVGGVDWVKEVGPAIRRWAHEETFDQYLNNFAKECEARNAN